jgi:hypothetical protein
MFLGCALRFLLRDLLLQGETDDMRPLFARTDKRSGEIIGAAIEVHRITGPGLLESNIRGSYQPSSIVLSRRKMPVATPNLRSVP